MSQHFSPGHVPDAADGVHLDDAYRHFFQAIPKAELHCHLYGSVRQRTFTDLARRNKAPLRADEIEAFYTRGEKPVGVLRVLRALDAHLISEPGDLHRLTYEYLADAAAQGVRYSEFFWNPTGTVRCSGMSYAQAQDAIVRAIHDAQHDHAITGRLIPSIDREAAPEDALAMVEWMLAARRPEVPGIGIDYRENDRPPELFWKAYRRARAAGLRCTAHAGEFGMHWRNVETAVELLGCDRIDHGYTIVDNPELAQRYVQRGLVFTVVPTNSYYLRTLPPQRWAVDHPIRRMAALGLKLHPNTDDPTLHQVTPGGAWQLMFSHLGFDLDALRQCMLNGLDAAWIDSATRSQWRQRWAAEYDRLRATLTTS